MNLRGSSFVCRTMVCIVAVVALGASTLATATAASAADPPTFTVGDATAVEGNAGTTVVRFPVLVTGDTGGAGVGVRYRTSPITASQDLSLPASRECFGSIDYVKGDGGLFFLNVNDGFIEITVCSDTLDEPNETFELVISEPRNGAVIGDSTGLGTIVDDDAPPNLRIANASFPEGHNAVATARTVPISLSAPSAFPITFTFQTLSGSAALGAACGGGVDAITTTGTATIPIGATAPVPAVQFSTCGDRTDEPNETVRVRLGSVSNALAPPDGTMTINDDDTTTSRLRVDDVVRDEGLSPQRLQIAVRIDVPAGVPVTVDVATADGTAKGGTACGAGDVAGSVDYISVSGPRTIPVGATRVFVDVTLCNDVIDEDDQTFFLNITNASGAAGIDDSQGQATISDNDAAPTLSITSSIQKTEGNSGVGIAAVAAVLTVNGVRRESEKTVSFTFTTANGSATAGTCGDPSSAANDYQAVARTVTMSPGVTVRAVAMAICGDTVVEASETFTWMVTAVQNATPPSPSTGTGTIVNDDSAVGIASLDPQKSTATVGEPFTYRFGWEVPDPLVWRDLSNMQLRLRDADGAVVAWLRWDEAEDTLRLVDPLTGVPGAAGHPGDTQVLSAGFGTVHLDECLTTGSGPTGQTVVLTLRIELASATAAETYRVEGSAALDSDPTAAVFATIGELNVLGGSSGQAIAPLTPTAAPSQPVATPVAASPQFTG